MNPPHAIVPLTIAEEAELEIWKGIRDDTRRRLSRSLSVAFLYLLAALAVGAYLLVAVAKVSRGTGLLMSWTDEILDVSFIEWISLSYGGLAVALAVGYSLTLLLIKDKLPASLCRIVGAVPWIGSTVRTVAVGELCQSVYLSVRDSQPYLDAFANAAVDVRHADLREWLSDASGRLRSGQPLVNALQSSPNQDQTLLVASSLVATGLPADESERVWHHAAAEAHLLARSRLDRATLIISTICLLGSVFVASFALLISTHLMWRLMDGVMMWL